MQQDFNEQWLNAAFELLTINQDLKQNLQKTAKNFNKKLMLTKLLEILKSLEPKSTILLILYIKLHLHLEKKIEAVEQQLKELEYEKIVALHAGVALLLEHNQNPKFYRNETFIMPENFKKTLKTAGDNIRSFERETKIHKLAETIKHP